MVQGLLQALLPVRARLRQNCNFALTSDGAPRPYVLLPTITKNFTLLYFTHGTSLQLSFIDVHQNC